jgi:hypothetical protein
MSWFEFTFKKNLNNVVITFISFWKYKIVWTKIKLNIIIQ